MPEPKGQTNGKKRDSCGKALAPTWSPRKSHAGKNVEADGKGLMDTNIQHPCGRKNKLSNRLSPIAPPTSLAG